MKGNRGKTPLILNLKKGKVSPTHVMKAFRGSRGITPLILNLRAK